MRGTNFLVATMALSALVLIEMAPVIVGTIILERFISRGLLAGAIKG